MGDYQNGFRDRRSVIDNIFALRKINEKLWEYNQSVQYLFIDFQNTYDSMFKIPTKLITVCKTCTKDKKCS